MHKMTPDELEKFIHRELRGLPVRHAPATLEARVLAALEEQKAVVWYHKSWSHWPAAFRAGFLAIALGLAGTTSAAFYLFTEGANADIVAHEFGRHFDWLARVYHAGAWFIVLCGRIVGGIPPLWLYGSLTLIAALYATFFGLGAAAYRVLYCNNQ